MTYYVSSGMLNPTHSLTITGRNTIMYGSNSISDNSQNVF